MPSGQSPPSVHISQSESVQHMMVDNNSGMAEKVEKVPEEIEITEEADKNRLKDRKFSWAKLRRVDSLNLEAGRLSFAGSKHTHSKVNWATTLSLAFQSIGVVYGDIGTSPLYVYSSTFTDGIGHEDDLIAVLSLIIYSIVLIPFFKYAFVVLRANDNGEGGTFALYSLLCRHVKVSLIPNQQPEDRELSNYHLDPPSNQFKRAYKIRGKLESSAVAKLGLFVITILATSMVIGDGVLTPSISVLSAVGGIKSLGQDAVVGISVAILVILFCAQRFGTDKVGYSFAPIVCLWFAFLSGIGLYNLFTYGWGVLRAFNPLYIVDYFRRSGKDGWISLGGVVLCITGTEAMFADLGHFNVRAIQMSFSAITLPSLLVVYCGQAAYLTKHPDHVSDTFYKSIPDPLYWPTFVVAVAASIIASQAMISGAFSIISQSLTLGCFPRVKVVHTSAKYEGQVYIPDINYMLMIACVIVTIAFRTTEKIGHAYGIAVVAVMVITTGMVTLIMLVIWKTNILWIILFCVFFGVVESIYLSSVLYKFVQGGYLPLAFSVILMTIMGIWHYVHQKRYEFELKNKVSNDYFKQLVEDPKINRMPGIGLLYSELVQGIPPIFPHFISSIPSIHSVLVFVSIKKLPISKVALEERFLFRHVEPREHRMFRCVVRYGYKDSMGTPDVLEQQLIGKLKEFIRHEHYIAEGGREAVEQTAALVVNNGKEKGSNKKAVFVEETLKQVSQSRTSSASIQSFNAVSSRIVSAAIAGAEEELKFVEKAKDDGVIYLLGEAEVMAEPNSSCMKKIIVDYGYNFLRRNFRQGEKVMMIPHSRLLRVGMTYEI
ncbi:ARABIDOPSIS THALIANA HIGH AFFINITY K+ TRANSPORTER 5, high affinity K+ transporter 5 [Hibiscus trionum]|uniref:Potassium transporter n=2 Tax=Hibiscus trionum TaxID=183268 RepID=A0A9W7LN00_HIBTR|nr:ARABIDOPSIS THALIANA HIGH AFFINITY K+ TRANSPORTER 5, high affinity K+ transporter 5 [Hibiscus trionum]